MIVDKVTLTRLLDKLKHKLAKLETMEFGLDEIREDEDIQGLVDRRLQVAIESCIDMVTMVIAALSLKRQDEAADVFRALARANIISKKLSEKLVDACGLRNVLVHECVDVDYNVVYKTKNEDLDNLREFAKAVSKLLEKDK